MSDVYTAEELLEVHGPSLPTVSIEVSSEEPPAVDSTSAEPVLVSASASVTVPEMVMPRRGPRRACRDKKESAASASSSGASQKSTEDSTSSQRTEELGGGRGGRSGRSGLSVGDAAGEDSSDSEQSDRKDTGTDCGPDAQLVNRDSDDDTVRNLRARLRVAVLAAKLKVYTCCFDNSTCCFDNSTCCCIYAVSVCCYRQRRRRAASALHIDQRARARSTRKSVRAASRQRLETEQHPLLEPEQDPRIETEQYALLWTEQFTRSQRE